MRRLDLFADRGGGILRRTKAVQRTILMQRGLLLVPRGFADFTSAAPPAATPPARAAFAVLGRGAWRGIFAFVGVPVFRSGVRLLEIILFFQGHCGEDLILLGDRPCCFEGVHLLASVDDERLWRPHGLIGADHDGYRETLFERAQMGALLVKNIKRHV